MMTDSQETDRLKDKHGDDDDDEVMVPLGRRRL
jgi:hypothetical protein